MANATVRLPITLTNQIRQSDPYTVYKITDNAEYQISKSSAGNAYGVLGKIAKMPQALRHNVLVGVLLKIFLHNSGNVGYGIRSYAYFAVSYDPETVNYNNRPNQTYSFATKSIPSGTSGTDLIYEEPTDSVDAMMSCKYDIYFWVDAGNDYGPLFTRAVLTDGVTAPYVEIIYDDTVKITSKISYAWSQLSGTVNPAEAKTLTWNLVKDTSSASGHCAEEEWDQASAVFRYRVQGESTWQTISVTGTTKGVTIPAYTFAPGNTYEYQISVTDEDGTVSETTVYTFTTPTTKIVVTMAPTSGYVNPRDARVFSWLYQTTAGPYPAGNTSLFWRVTGSNSWTEVQAEYGENSLTIPANTFPVASTIEWYLSGTDSTGNASQTAVYSFNTSAGRVTATPVSPISTVESNNDEITLTWTYTSADGFAPSRFILYWKLITDDIWTVLVDSATDATSYTAPANTFTAGEIQWYVLPYNIDGVAGSGDRASFIAYGAPETPVVSAEAVPYTTVIWQATGQEAYEVQVDGTTYGPYFGTEKQFELPEKLEDGQHTIRVRIIGVYGLWSQYGTIIISITNSPGSSIKLSNTGNILPLFASFPTQDNPLYPTVTAQWSEDRQQASITGNTGAFGAELWLYETEISVGGTIEDAIPSCLRYDTPYTVSYETTDDNVSLYVTIGMRSMITTGGELTFSIPVGTNYMYMYLSIPRQTSVDATIKITMPDVVNPVEQMMIWETEEETDDYYVLRDGKTIGHTTEKEFHDRFASGKHVYQVINRLPSGNYSISNELTLVTEADGAYIALLSGGEWLKIKYMLKDYSDQQYEESIETVYNHFAGDHYPSASISNYCERSLKYSAVFPFTEEADHAKFKSMLKRPIIMKFENGNLIVGVIDSWTVLHRKHYYTAYTFSLRQIEWEDYVDDTT